MSVKKQLIGSADALETAFYDAISRADLEGLMALWADDEEIACIHPNAARLIGPAAIRASWEAVFERGSVHIRPLQVHAIHNMLSAIHSVIEHLAQPSDMPQDVHIVATNVYIKTPHGWRIACHHASIASGKAPLDLVNTSVLH